MDETAVIKEHRGLVLDLARSLARRYKLRRFMDDLVAFGNEGLLEASRRYDPSRGAAFSTFAWYRVRGRMLDGCRTFGLVERRRKTALAAEGATNDHMQERFEASDGIGELADESMDELATGLDEMVADVGAIFLLFDQDDDRLEEAADEPSPEEVVVARRMGIWIRERVETLEERHRVVLEMSFFQGKTLDDIGARFGCSRSWASRMRAAAVSALRRVLIREGYEP